MVLSMVEHSDIAPLDPLSFCLAMLYPVLPLELELTGMVVQHHAASAGTDMRNMKGRQYH